MKGGIILVLAMFSSMAIAQDGSRLQEGFERLDVDDDGKLTTDELNFAPRLKSRLEGADKNRDGGVTYSEFSEVIMGSMPKPSTSSAVGANFGPGDHTRVVMIGEVERRYEVHVPESFDPEQEIPVVIAFHGGGGNPQTMVPISRLNEKSDEAGFIVVYPYGSGINPDRNLTFNGGECCGFAMHHEIDDVGYIRAVLEDLAGVAKVDQGAVFATGLSNGGIMSYRLAAELSDRIAAIAPVGGPLMMESINPKRPVAVIHFHGTADNFAPFDGGFGKNGQGGKGVTDFRSVDDSIQTWVKVNQCESEPRIEKLPDEADDGMEVTRFTWAGGEGGTEVVLIAIDGGGHTWPGVQPPGAASFLGPSTKDISANDLMWEFFLKHRR